MRFSEQFGIARSDDDDWFDPILGQDTLLAVDPYLAFEDGDTRWQFVREKVFDFFRIAHELALRTPRTREPKNDMGARFLRCTEPFEFCLGVSTHDPYGHGTGPKIAQGMVEVLERLAIADPETPVTHIEVFTLFMKGVAFDLISDMFCTIIKQDLIGYTQEVARRHDLPMQMVEVKQARWIRPGRWIRENVMLPINREQTDRRGRNIGVLLVPERWLRPLRRPDLDGFAHWTEYADEADELRMALNLDAYDELTREEKTSAVMKAVWEHPELAQAWARFEETTERDAYDIDKDERRLVRYPEYGAQMFALSAAADVLLDDPSHDFCEWVRALAEQFVHTVEHQGGWTILWERGTGKHVLEDISQAVANVFFLGHCHQKDVQVSRELDVGRGLVDFHFSRGRKHRALIEVKHMDNSRLVHGATGQLPQYMTSEQIKCGFLLCVAFEDQHLLTGKTSKRKRVIDACAEARERGFNIRPIFIDATRKQSASKTT